LDWFRLESGGEREQTQEFTTSKEIISNEPIFTYKKQKRIFFSTGEAINYVKILYVSNYICVRKFEAKLTEYYRIL
jgi:hypothetical protein